MSRSVEQGRQGTRLSRAVFLDRDGTLIREVGYLRNRSAIRLVPGAAQAVRLINQAGLRAIVVTNQSAVARGLLTEEHLNEIHATLSALLDTEQARLEAFYYCPHLPAASVARYARTCSCRKPEPGLLLQAARDFDLDLTASFLIGDSARDVEAGRRAGSRTILIPTRTDSQYTVEPKPAEPSGSRPDHRARDILEAVNWILENWIGG